MKPLRSGLILAAVVLYPALTALAFPNPVFGNGLPFAAPFALFFLFFLLLKTEKSRFLSVPASGVLTYLFVCYWLWTFNPLAMIFVCTVMAFAYLLLAVYAAAVRRLFGDAAWIAAAAGFTVFEALKTVGFLAFPYGIIGYTQYSVPGVRGIAAVLGVFGVSFCLAFPAAFFAAAIGNSIKETVRNFPIFLKKQRIAVGGFAVFFVTAIVFGAVQIASVKPTGESVKILTVQHSGDTWSGGFQTYRRNYEILKKLTDDALTSNADSRPYDFVIWPETALVPGIDWHTRYDTDPQSKELVRQFLEWAKTVPGTFITGNSESVIGDPSLPPVVYDSAGIGRLNRRSYNAAVVLKNGRVEGVYRKRHLVPIVEDFPLKESFPAAVRFLEAHGCQLWDRGESSVLFKSAGGVPFAVNICYEDVFSDISREDVRNGARLLINLTNDLWAESDAAQRQHAAIAVFRSIETGLPTIRATNSGTTAVILPNGRIQASLPPFLKTTLTADVPLFRPSKTVNAFVLRNGFAPALAAAVIIAAAYRMKRAAVFRKSSGRGKLAKKK